MLLKDFIKDGVAALSALYPKDEARSMVMFYCADVFGFPSYQHITEPKTEVPADLLEQAQDDMRRLAASEPLQRCILPLPAWERSELWMRMWWIYPICSGR